MASTRSWFTHLPSAISRTRHPAPARWRIPTETGWISHVSADLLHHERWSRGGVGNGDIGYRFVTRPLRRRTPPRRGVSSIRRRGLRVAAEFVGQGGWR